MINFTIILPAGIYLFEINNRNTKTMCETCSKLTIKIPERRQWCRSGVFIVNFEHIPHFVLVFLLLTFEQVNAGWAKADLEKHGYKKKKYF